MRVFRSIAVAGVMVITTMAPAACASGHQKWPKPNNFDSSSARKVLFSDPSVAVGEGGYAVFAWTQFPARYPSFSEAAKRHSTVMVRVRRPGMKGFGAVRAIGRGVSSSVSTGANGFTVLAWISNGGQQVVMTRRPRGTWGHRQVIRGPKVGSTGRLSVGPDGTAVIARAFDGSSRGRVSHILATVRSPASRRFGRWQRIDSDAFEVGSYLDVEAGSNGTATAAWGSPCPLGVPLDEIKSTQYVDMTASHQGFSTSEPKFVENAKCPTFYLNLESDDAGRQYLLIGGSENILEVKVAKRPVEGTFRQAKSLSRPTERPGSSKLVVTPGGRVIALWDSYFPEKGHIGWVRSVSQGMGAFSVPQRLSKRRVFYLGDVAPYKDGALASIWMSKNFRLGFGIIPRDAPIRRVTFPWSRLRTRNLPRLHVEVSQDGRAIAWWAVENDQADTVALRWTELRRFIAKGG